MKLTHATSSANAMAIYQTGKILPRRGKGNWNIAPSMENFVYFCNDEASQHFYGTKAALISNTDIAIISVEVEEDKLYPDENLYAESDIYYKDDMPVMQKKAIDNKKDWKRSLENLNVVCHKGEIPVDSIIDIETLPVAKSMFWGFVEHYEVRDIEAFDTSFHIYLHLLKSIPDQPIDFRDLSIMPLDGDSGEHYLLTYKDFSCKVHYER
jgi:hypothetical protein